MFSPPGRAIYSVQYGVFAELSELMKEKACLSTVSGHFISIGLAKKTDVLQFMKALGADETTIQGLRKISVKNWKQIIDASNGEDDTVEFHIKQGASQSVTPRWLGSMGLVSFEASLKMEDKRGYGNYTIELRYDPEPLVEEALKMLRELGYTALCGSIDYGQ